MTIEAATETSGGTTTGAEVAATLAPTGDAAALAAAREAMGKAAEEAPPAADGAPATPAATPAPAPPAEVEALTELGKLRAEIRAKEQEQKQRERLDGEYRSKFEAAVAEERKKLAAQAKAEVLAEYREKLRLTPREALEEAQVDGVNLVKTLAERAGPQGQALAEIAKLRAELEALRTGGASADVRAELDAFKKAREQEAAAAREHQVQQSHRQLVTMVTEKVPAAVHFYGSESAVTTRAQAIADEYCAAKGVGTCPFPVIVQELEAEARKGAVERAKALKAQYDEVSKLLQQSGEAPASSSESNGRKQAPRTLSAAGASERRASPKPVSEMSPAEIDEAARFAAREAMGPKVKPRMG